MSMNQPVTFPASKLGGTTYVQSVGGSSPTSYLFYDTTAAYSIPGVPASGKDGTAHLTTTTISGVSYPVSAAVEVQSTLGGFLLPRMTTTQRTATTGGPTGRGFISAEGMMVYDTDLDGVMVYASGSWVQLGASGGGTVVGPNPSTLHAIPTWGNLAGTSLTDNVVTVDPTTGVFLGVGTIAASAGTVGAPTYAFTGDANTGMYHSSAETIDFAVNGEKTFEIQNNTGAAADFLSVLASVASGTTAAPVGATPLLAANGSDAVVDVGVKGKGASSGLSLLSDTGNGVLKLWNGTTAYTGLVAGANATNTLYTFPAAFPGVNNAALLSSTTGTLSWGSADLSTVVTTASNFAAANEIILSNGTTRAVKESSITYGTVANTLVMPASSIIQNGNGAAATPSYTFLAEQDTGMYHPATNVVGFASNGALQFSVGAAVAATNYLNVFGAINGGNPTILAVGATDADVTIALQAKGAGAIGVQSVTAANPGTLRIYEASTNGANYSGFTVAAALGGNIVYQLPTTAPTAAQVLAYNIGTAPYQLQWSDPAVSGVDDVGVARGTLTASNVAAMYGAPVELIAGTADQIIIVRNITLTLVYDSAQYTAGGAVSVQYGNTVHAGGTLASATIAAAGINGATANQFFTAAGVSIPNNTATASYEGEGIYISNATAAFATGDSSINWTIEYEIVYTT